MNIAILATPSLLPKVRKLVDLFRVWGPAFPKHHKHTFYTTPGGRVELSSLILGLPNCIVSAAIPGTLRSFPLDQNEPFHAIAKHETEREWFYLGDGTLPLDPDWIDRLQTAYDAADKTILGRAAYTPKRFRDASGIDRVADGPPYILEAAVYPASYLDKTKYQPLHRTHHHEVFAGNERYQNAALTDLIGSANFEKNAPIRGESVITRLVGTDMVEALLAGEKPLAAPAKMQVLESKPVIDGVPPPKEEIVASFKVATNDAGKKVIQLGAPKVTEALGIAPINTEAPLPPDEGMPSLDTPIPADEVVWVNPPEATQPEVQPLGVHIGPAPEPQPIGTHVGPPPEPVPLIETVTLKTPMASAKKKVTVPKRAKKRAKFRHILRQS